MCINWKINRLESYHLDLSGRWRWIVRTELFE